MMKNEFESLYGQEVTMDEYAKVEYCYTSLDNLSPEKKDIVNLYKLLGADMFDRLYKDVSAFNQRVQFEREEADRLVEKLRYCESCLEEFKEYVNNIDFVLTNNIKYVNSRTKELLGDLDKFESEV